MIQMENVDIEHYQTLEARTNVYDSRSKGPCRDCPLQWPFADRGF